MSKLLDFSYIFFTLIFTVYGQIILKWRIEKIEFRMSEGNFFVQLNSLLNLLFDPYVISSFMAALIASLFWMVAMSKFEISVAYPFMSLAPAIVFILGVLFLNETFTIGKVIGLIFIIIGLIITVKY